MQSRKTLGLCALLLAVAGSQALAEERNHEQAERAELAHATSATLQAFYSSRPALQGTVAAAPGYAVFRTYGASFVFGGSGGEGLMHDNRTGQDTRMSIATVSVGLQLGAAESAVLVVFKSPQAMQRFVRTGWLASSGATLPNAPGGNAMGIDDASTSLADADTYTLTRHGLQTGAALAGSKAWSDDDHG